MKQYAIISAAVTFVELFIIWQIAERSSSVSCCRNFAPGDYVRTDELLASSRHQVHRLQDSRRRRFHLHSSGRAEHVVSRIYSCEWAARHHCWTHWTGICIRRMVVNFRSPAVRCLSEDKPQNGTKLNKM